MKLTCERSFTLHVHQNQKVDWVTEVWSSTSEDVRSLPTTFFSSTFTSHMPLTLLSDLFPRQAQTLPLPLPNSTQLATLKISAKLSSTSRTDTLPLL
jgi:hypothetical protein